MNRIKLIKPFANYEVWEYELQSSWRYNFSNWVFRLTHCLHKDIVERFKDHFEEVKERPTSWGSLWEIDWYWVDDCGGVNVAIYCNSSSDEEQSIFKTEQQAEASIALAQITQLLAKYGIPEESDIWYNKKSSTATSWLVKRSKLLEFDTEEKCSHFYKHHADLISKLAPFYIF